MSDFKPKPGSFTPYLEYMNRDKEARPPAPVSPLSLLEFLQTSGELKMVDLQTRSGMDPSRYLDALKSLRDAEYISIEGPQLGEVVKITDKGVQVARLARPA